jgi:hypothetical protein
MSASFMAIQAKSKSQFDAGPIRSFSFKPVEQRRKGGCGSSLWYQWGIADQKKTSVHPEVSSIKPASGCSSNGKARFTGPTPPSGLIKKVLRRQDLWDIQ